MIDARKWSHEKRRDGFEVMSFMEWPGTIYPEHEHEKTLIYIEAGEMCVRLAEQEPVVLKPGDELAVDTDQRNSVEFLGDNVCKFAAAWDPAEVEPTQQAS